jgi:hypothetical protein
MANTKGSLLNNNNPPTWDDKTVGIEAGGPTTTIQRYHEAGNFYKEDLGNKKTLESKEPRSSLIQLFGDEFAQVQASSVFLLEDLTDEQGGTSLTNNGTIDLTRVEDQLPLRGYTIPTFNGSTQYFSMATEAKVEVGTNSFIAKIDFKTEIQDATDILFMYGDTSASEQNWRMYLSAGQMATEIDDGTNSVFDLGGVKNQYSDGKWHTAVMFVDRTNDIMYMIVDGELISSISISTVTLTLDNASTNFYIGITSALNSWWQGELSNFQLYDDADPNVLYSLIPILSNPQLRESARGGTGAIHLANDSSARINNLFGNNQTSDALNDYETCIINTSEGIYDLLELYAIFTNRTDQADIYIDGNLISRTNQQASLVWNVRKETKGIYLSEGSHILKIQSTKDGATNAFIHAWQMIELVKRDGDYNESDEATSGVLFGEEINQRENVPWSYGIDTNSIYNSFFEVNAATAVGGDYTEGDFFLKKGLYRFTITVSRFTDMGLINLWVGGVKIIDKYDNSGTLLRNVPITREVFVEGGKTTIRLASDTVTNGTDFRVFINSMRFELIDGKSEGDVVSIRQDLDGDNIRGTDESFSIQTTARFNSLILKTPHALNDEQRYIRYFSGGTYLVKWLYGLGLNGGVIDVGIDSPSGNNLFDGVTHQGAFALNKEVYTIINIARGFHDISFFVQADGGTSDFQYFNQFMTFTKIGERLDESDNNQDTIIESGHAKTDLGTIEADAI